MPKGFDRDGTPSDVENNEESFEFSTTQDKDVNLVNYLSGLIRTEERKPIGDTSKIKDKKEMKSELEKFINQKKKNKC